MEKRVVPAAERLGSKWLDVPPAEWTWPKNEQFLKENMSQARQGNVHIYDIGYQRNLYHGPGSIYQQECAYLRENNFERVSTGRWVSDAAGKKYRVYEWVAK